MQIRTDLKQERAGGTTSVRALKWQCRADQYGSVWTWVSEKVKDAFSTVSHKTPEVTHRNKILLAVSSAAPQMPDHRSGYFFGELLHPYEVFTGKGWDVDIVSETGTAQPDEFSLDKMAASGDKTKWNDKQHPIHAKLSQLHAASQVNPASYSAMYFAGAYTDQTALQCAPLAIVI